MKLEQV